MVLHGSCSQFEKACLMRCYNMQWEVAQARANELLPAEMSA